MIRLRTILLSNKPYYIIFAIAIIYFLIINNFITFKSKYDDLTTFTGIITNIEIKDYGFKLYIKNKEKIIAYYYLEKEEIKEITNSFSLGDTININCKELVINNNTIENTFNYKRYLYNQKIFHVVEITNIKLIKQNTNIFYELKNILLKRSIKLSKSYSYINSLLFGNNAFLESDVLESYRSNGISHLFAISGLHISIFVSIFEKVLKKFKVRENKRYISIIIFLIFYMFLTNFSMSILRAAIFTILGIINKIFYFYIKPANLLLLTLAIIIFINPLYLFNIGLQFSFLISLYLIIYSNLINNCKSKLLMTSLISFFVSLPIVINNFYQVNFL